MISCVIPAGAHRPALLARAVASLTGSLAGTGTGPAVELIVEDEAPSCGAGWNSGAARATGSYLWLLSDDVELVAVRDLAWALDACDAGEIVCPTIYWPDGRLQGAGGFGRDLEAGATAANCIFPLMSRATWDEIGGVPPLNHFCDIYVTSWAQERRRGPVVVRGLALSHAIVSPDTPGEDAAYQWWLANGA